ncbi:MAG: hypothetical protein ACYS1C_01785 [Planctomycetota bacterium]
MTGEDAIEKSVEKLKACLEQHRRLLRSLMQNEEDDVALLRCPELACPHERMLRRTLLEAIEVLEQTRKSFKSRQLEQLRKQLMRVLAEEA